MRELLAAALASLIALLPLPAPEEPRGAPPEAESFELVTRRNRAVGGCLSAKDADGEIVSFEISTGARKGKIWLGEGGRFVYTPREDCRGSDYFGYRARDDDGNISQEATVIVQIKK